MVILEAQRLPLAPLRKKGALAHNILLVRVPETHLSNHLQSVKLLLSRDCSPDNFSTVCHFSFLSAFVTPLLFVFIIKQIDIYFACSLRDQFFKGRETFLDQNGRRIVKDALTSHEANY